MNAPLQSRWSPAGYQVVEVSDPAVPVVRVLPQSCDQPHPPSSPMGYRVVVVAEVFHLAPQWCRVIQPRQDLGYLLVC